MAEVMQPHILVVDDDPQIRALLQEYLSESGLRVTVASTGKQLSQILADEPIDLIILDLRLAGEDGMTLTPLPARSIHDPDRHVIRCSRRSRPRDGTRARR